MARLAMVEKTWFCPTDPELLPYIAEIFHGDINTVLDPCCGDGRVVEYLCRAWDAAGYGNEINRDRYNISKERLDKVALGPQETLHLQGYPDFIWTNPPYDWSEDTPGQRMETVLVRDMLSRLAGCGTGIGILVPEHVAKRKTFCGVLLSWLRTIEVFRTPAEIYNRDGHQVLIAGRMTTWYSGGRRAEYVQSWKINNLVAKVEAAPVLGECDLPRIEIRTTWARDQMSALWNTMATGERAIAAYADNPLLEVKAMQDITRMPTLSRMRPIMQPRPGHLSHMLNVGLMDAEEVELDGRTWMLMGCDDKKIVRTVEMAENGSKETITEVEVPISKLILLDKENGEFRTLRSDQDSYRAFLKQHLPILLDRTLASCPPQYKYDCGRFERIYDLCHSPSVLPQDPTFDGPLLAQKHIAAALVGSLERGEHPELVGERGVGKTFDAILTSVCYARARGVRHPKVVVLCPPITVPVWKHEVEAILSEFKAKVFIIGQSRKQMHLAAGRDLSVATLDSLEHYSPAKGKKAKRRKPILDLIEFFEHPGMAFAIVDYETAKANMFWEPVAIARHSYHRTMEDGAIKLSFWSCPHCGEVLANQEKAAIPSSEPLPKAQRKCAGCGQALYQYVPFSYGGKWAAARFISDHYARQYFLIADESHHTGGADTNVGAAFGLLSYASAGALSMTGTSYNGYAERTFFRSYRLSPSFREQWDATDKQTFLKEMGLYQKVTSRYFRKTSAQGYSSEVEEERTVERPIPGATSRLVVSLLSRSVFIAKDEMGLELVPFLQKAMPITPSSAMMGGIGELSLAYEHCKKVMRLTEGRALHMFSKWAWAALGWLDSGAQEILRLGKESFLLPPVIRLPKQQRIADLVVDRVNHGRGCLVFVEQWHRRPTWPKLQSVLLERGLNVMLLDDKSKPEDRLELLTGHARRCRALGTSPVVIASGGLIYEGVTLLDYPTIVEFGTNFNVVNVMQRDDRAHRINQDKEVEVIFPYYEQTHQEDALRHIAAKMKACDEVEGHLPGAISTHFDAQGGFMREIIEGVADTSIPSVRELLATVVVGTDLALETAIPIEAAEIPQKEYVLVTVKSKSGKQGEQFSMFGEV